MDDQNNIAAIKNKKHVRPFIENVYVLEDMFVYLDKTINKTLRVQMLWCSLEAVFTGGDIAKQMPTQAKQFQMIDKGWARIMSIANEVRLVKNTSENDIIKTLLPDLEKGLIECQKQLES